MILNLFNNLYDFILYTKYFVYFIFFLIIFINNIFYYKLFNKSNNYLIKLLYFSIKLNGCVLIKFIQWINNNTEMLNIKNSFLNLFNNFYENNTIHSLSYTRKIFKKEFDTILDEILELDNNFNIKSGSIAQIYKGKIKNINKNIFNNKYNNFYNYDIAIKVVHPEIIYQMFFPINFIYFYKYLINNISFLKKYDTIFNFKSFFDNLKLQSNMNNEYNNMLHFYNEYENNKYIIIPYPLYSSKNILLMQYIDGNLLRDMNVSDIEKQKIFMFFNLFLKDLYFFFDYFHCDLHDYNWKVKKYQDFYQIIIYDFGYIMKNDMSDILKKFVYYTDTNNIEGFAYILYNSIQNINIEKNIFNNNLNNYLKNLVPYNDDSIIQIYKFCYINNYKLKNQLLEIFISMILIRNNFKKYLTINRDNQDKIYFDINLIIKLNIAYITLCEKYNIFPRIKEHIKSNYLNKKTVKENYKYNNNFYDLLEGETQIISI